MRGFGGAEFGLLFLALWLLFLIGGIVGCIIFLVTVWRHMRAHESIAETLKELTRLLYARPPK